MKITKEILTQAIDSIENDLAEYGTFPDPTEDSQGGVLGECDKFYETIINSVIDLPVKDAFMMAACMGFSYGYRTRVILEQRGKSLTKVN
jgi:hypothetical protein